MTGWEDNLTGTEAITVTLKRDGESDVARSVAKALRRATNPNIVNAQGFDYLATYCVWNIPASRLETGDEIFTGDEITDADSVVWVVQISELLSLQTRWRCTCVKKRSNA